MAVLQGFEEGGVAFSCAMLLGSYAVVSTMRADDSYILVVTVPAPQYAPRHL